MAQYGSSLKDWGAEGVEYPTGHALEAQREGVAPWQNYLFYHLIDDVKNHLVPLTNSRLESDSGTTKPSSPEPGHLFFDTNSGELSIYNSNSDVWEDLRDADSYKGNDIDSDGDGVVDKSDVTKGIETRTSDPSSPDDGQIWIRTDL